MEYITVLDFDDGKVYQYENLDHFKDGWNENKVNGEQHIGESAFIPMLVKAVQELSQKNEALEKRIEELEN